MSNESNGVAQSTPVPPYPFLGPVHQLPQPLAMDLAVNEVMINGSRCVAMQIATVAGVNTFFFEAEQAERLGRLLTRLGGGGIEIVPGGSSLARQLAERGRR